MNAPIRAFTSKDPDLNRKLAQLEESVYGRIEALKSVHHFEVVDAITKSGRIARPGQFVRVLEPVEVLLPAPEKNKAGLPVVIWNLSGEAITLKPLGGRLNGATSGIFPGARTLLHDGKDWFCVGSDDVLFDVTWFGASPRASAAVNDRAFQAAVTAAGLLGGGKVRVPAGRYRKLAQLNVPANALLEGEGDASVLDYSGVTATTVAIATTGSQAAGAALAADAAEGADDLNVASTGFATDDWVKVYSEAATGSTGWKKGEIARISDASTMTLYDPLCDTYAVADTATVAKLTLVENVTFSRFRIIGPADNTVVFSGILADRTLGARLLDLTFERCHFYGVAVQDSVDWQVAGCKFNKSETGAQAYGVAVLNASQDGTITCCRGWRLRHLVTHGGFTARHGVPRRTVTSTCTASQARNSGFDAHAGAEDVSFCNCTVLGSESDGFTIECASATLTGCTVRDSVGPGFHLNTESSKPYRVTLDGCSVSGKGNAAGRSAVQIQVSTGFELFDGIVIANCNFADCRYGLRTINAETGRIENLTISGTSFKNCGLDGDAVIQVVHAQGVTVSGCTINDSTSSVDGVSLSDVADFAVTGNVIRLTNSGGCRGVRCLTTCADGAISGNEVDTGASGVGVDLANTVTNVTVGNDNHLRGCPTPLALGTGAGHKLAQVNEVSTNRGDASVTLLHYSEQTQLFDTPLTATRTVTLPVGNVKQRFRVVRSANATGAFNLNVGTGPLKALTAAGQWCDVEADGTNYRLTAAGTL